MAATDRHGTVRDLSAARPHRRRRTRPPRSTTTKMTRERAPGWPDQRDDGRMGALVTLRLPDDSPLHELPWIITFGPLGDDEDWEPVVSGPYERAHALALAQSVVADEELMAVVEPCMPHISTDGDPRRDRGGPDRRRSDDERPADGSLDDLDLEDADDDGETFGERRRGARTRAAQPGPGDAPAGAGSPPSSPHRGPTTPESTVVPRRTRGLRRGTVPTTPPPQGPRGFALPRRHRFQPGGRVDRQEISVERRRWPGPGRRSGARRPARRRG